MKGNKKNLIDPKIYYENILNTNMPLTIYGNNNSNNLINNLNILNSDSENIIKPKRKSKNSLKGRTFICKICYKSYLSYPALYTHCKKIHNKSNDISDRKRGRPKKYVEKSFKEKFQHNPINLTYFLKEERTGITEIYDFPNCINEAFNIIYDCSNKKIKERNFKKKIKEYDKIYEHPFLGKFLLSKHERNINIENEKEICDNVFMHYLNKMSLNVNPNYFIKLIVFVTLFREFINISKRIYLYNQNEEFNIFENEYTANHSAEDIPFFCNDFINNFLDCENKLFNFDKQESIDLTQNFCNWIYDNDFTTLKLSLIAKNIIN